MSLAQALSTAVSGLRVRKRDGPRRLPTWRTRKRRLRPQDHGPTRSPPPRAAAASACAFPRSTASSTSISASAADQTRRRLCRPARELLSRLQRLYGEPGSPTRWKRCSIISARRCNRSPPARNPPPAASAERRASIGATAQLHDRRYPYAHGRGAGLSDAVARANNAMQQIAHQPAGWPARAGDSTTAALLDERDSYVQQLSELMDVRTVENEFPRSRSLPIPASSLSARKPAACFRPARYDDAERPGAPIRIRNVGTIVDRPPAVTSI